MTQRAGPAVPAVIVSDRTQRGGAVLRVRLFADEQAAEAAGYVVQAGHATPITIIDDEEAQQRVVVAGAAVVMVLVDDREIRAGASTGVLVVD